MSTPDEFVKAVGAQIRRFREECGLTQQQLGDRIGVSRFVISAYENGRYSPGLLNLVRLADALGLWTDQLLGRRSGSLLEQFERCILRLQPESRDGLRRIIHSYLKDHRIVNLPPAGAGPALHDARSLQGMPPRSSPKEDAE